MTQTPDTVVVLDLDGVILDFRIDTTGVRRRLGELFQEVNRAPAFQTILATLESELQSLERRDRRFGDEFRKRAWSIIDEEEMRRIGSVEPCPDFYDFLKAVEGLPLALYTNNSAESARAALGRVGVPLSRFFHVRARQGPYSIKPSAEPLLDIISRAPTPPARLFFAGDRRSDMESGRMSSVHPDAPAGTRIFPVARIRPWTVPADMEAAGARFFAHDLLQVAELALTPPTRSSISMIILAFNEEGAIGSAVADARTFRELYAPDAEIVVVDDGSSDRTCQEAVKAGSDLRLIRHEVNRGMGAAMRSGYLAAEKDYIVSLPGDRQVRPQALLPFLSRLSENTVVVSDYAAPPYGVGRRFISRMFRLALRWIGGLSVNFAGAYAFHRRHLASIDLRRLRSETFVLSFELLDALRRGGARIERVRIHPLMRQIGGSRVLKPGRILRVFKEILLVRYGRK